MLPEPVAVGDTMPAGPAPTTMLARARALDRRRLRFPEGPAANAVERVLGRTGA